MWFSNDPPWERKFVRCVVWVELIHLARVHFFQKGDANAKPPFRLVTVELDHPIQEVEELGMNATRINIQFVNSNTQVLSFKNTKVCS